MDGKVTSSAPKLQPQSTDEAEEAGSVQEEQRTPLQPGKGVKRRNPSPTPIATTFSSPSSTAVFVTPSKDRDDGKPSSAKKRRKSASSSLALGKVGSPSTFNPAAMTERQQMAYLLQMTDPQKKAEESPVKEGQVTPGRVHKRNERGETPLHITCIRGDLRLATSLIEQGAEVNATDHAGWTPLHEACNHGHLELVSLLLRSGAGTNTRGMDGDTPLHDATINNHTQVVKLLMEHGSDPNLANEKEQTPLDICSNQEILQILTNPVTRISTPPRTQSTSSVDPSSETPVPARSNRQRVLSHGKSELEEKQESAKEEEKQFEEDSAFLPEPLSTPLQSQHSMTTSSQSTVSSDSAAAIPRQSAVGITPSRTRRRTKRERGFGAVGKVFSDVSSSESDSELMVMGRKVPRLMDRLPASVREEGSVDVSQGDREEEREEGSLTEGDGEGLERGEREGRGESGVVEGVGGEGEVCGLEGEKDKGKTVGREDKDILVEGVGAIGREGGESNEEDEEQRQHARIKEHVESKEEADNEMPDDLVGPRETGSKEDVAIKEAGTSERIMSEEDDLLPDNEQIVAAEQEEEGKPAERHKTTAETAKEKEDPLKLPAALVSEPSHSVPCSDKHNSPTEQRCTEHEAEKSQPAPESTNQEEDTEVGSEGEPQNTEDEVNRQEQSEIVPTEPADIAGSSGDEGTLGVEGEEREGGGLEAREEDSERGGEEKDGGSGEKDGGDQEENGESNDGGREENDGGSGEMDTGRGEKDGGSREMDVGSREMDVGSGEKDGGSGEMDVGGGEMVDVGSGEMDTGSGEKDVGGGEMDGEGGEKDVGDRVEYGGSGETAREKDGGSEGSGEEDGGSAEEGESREKDGEAREMDVGSGEMAREDDGGSGEKEGEAREMDGGSGEKEGEAREMDGGSGEKEGEAREMDGGSGEKEGGAREMDGGSGEKEGEGTEGGKEPVNLILSIPFHHIKFKKGRGRSPSTLKLVRTSSKDRAPHETSMLVQHGKVETVSSLLLRGGGGKAEASGVTVKTVERIDTVASLEVRGCGRGVALDKYAKHGVRKALPVTKKASVKDVRVSGEGEGVGEVEEHGWSGMDLGWEARSTRDVKPLAGGIPGRVVEEPGSRSSPTLSRGRDSEEEEGVADRQSDDSDSSCGTVVSLSTSLPIIFSGLHHQQQQQQQQRPSPLVCGGTTAPGASCATSAGDLGAGSAGGASGDGGKDGAAVSTDTKPVLMVAAVSGEKSASSMKTSLVKDSALDVDESISLPPKLRCRPVLRSAVVQQRREGAGHTPTSSHLPFFLLSPQQPRHPQRPTSPKVVYPPIHTAMYKLFSEQEAERVQLLSAHLTQQDRLLHCMEQELVRAHQRASRQCCTISVCAVLLERLLPRAEAIVPHTEAMTEDRLAVEHNGDLPEGGQSVDERLLASLVQDVWDKFCTQRTLLLTRQRHEAQALWMVQHQQWTDRLKDLGFCHLINFPTMHVPKLFC